MDEVTSSQSGGREPLRRSEERRTVTTLFCDLAGFTALSERNDPEIVDAFLRRCYAGGAPGRRVLPRHRRRASRGRSEAPRLR